MCFLTSIRLSKDATKPDQVQIFRFRVHRRRSVRANGTRLPEAILNAEFDQIEFLVGTGSRLRAV
jgi:hypothetical protein